MSKPAKGKAKTHTTAEGRKVSYGQAGAKPAPGTTRGDPNSPLRLSRKRWGCEGEKSKK